MTDEQAVQPDDYAKYGAHSECVAEFDRLRETMREQFAPCPKCGCRTSDDADVRDCGCDAGCNDGEYPPGVNVLLAEARAQGAATEREACANLAEQQAETMDDGSFDYLPIAAATLRDFAVMIRARTTP